MPVTLFAFRDVFDPVSALIVCGRGDSGVRQMLPEQLDIAFRAGCAVVRMVQEEFDAI